MGTGRGPPRRWGWSQNSRRSIRWGVRLLLRVFLRGVGGRRRGRWRGVRRRRKGQGVRWTIDEEEGP